MNSSILVVEDDRDFQKYIKDLLVESGYLVRSTGKGSEALNMIDENTPDLVLLDLGLPDVKGEGLTAQLRKEYPDLPIIILTAKDSTMAKVEGLNMGADDYVTKPIVPEELIARVQARLRTHVGNEKITVGDLTLDPKKVEVHRGNKEIHLTPREFTLLEYLISNRNVVLSREMILNRVWSYATDVETRVVDVYMGYLRKKIDEGFKKKLIHSVRGFGYLIKE